MSGVESSHPAFAAAPLQTQTTFRTLVEAVYTLRDPQQIQVCQAQLHEYQRGQHAYALAADVFQNSTEPNIKFFAALTVAIKLNHDSSLAGHDLELLLQELVRWLSVAIAEDLPAFVVRRICSTIVTAYLIPHTPLTRLFPLLCSSLADGVSRDATVDTDNVVRTLPDKQLKYLLECAKILAEELRETGHNVQMDKVHRRASTNVKDIVSILSICYERNLAGEPLASAVTMCNCHLQWTKYSKSNAVDRQDHVALCGLLKLAVDFLEDAIEDEKAFEAICALLEKCLKDANVSLGKEVTDAFEKMLWGPFGRQLLHQIADGGLIDECLQFGTMVLAYCKRRTRDSFAPSANSSEVGADSAAHTAGDGTVDPKAGREAVMAVAHLITDSLRADEFDDSIASAAIGFWEDFVQDTRDYRPQDETFSYAAGALPAMCQACRLPAEDEDDEILYDVAEQVRSRVRDFLQVMCEECGMRVATQLLSILDKTWSESNTASDDAEQWRNFEPALYLLTELGESIQFATEIIDDVEADTTIARSDEENVLSRIFNADWFAVLLDIERSVPNHVRRLATKMITEFQQYFDHRPGPLSQALGILMQQLKDGELAAAAATTMESLCSENRSDLADSRKDMELMRLAQDYFDYEAALPKAKKALVAAAASVVEAIEDEEKKDSAFQWLLRIITTKLDRCVNSTHSSAEVQEQAAVQTLELLCSIGRASGSPEEEQYLRIDRANDQRSKYWDEGPGSQTQDRVVQIVRVALSAGDSHNKHLDKACDVMQLGCRELIGGPFVFKDAARVSFLTSIPVSHPQTDSVVKLATAVVSTQSRTRSSMGANSLDEVHLYLLRIIEHLQHPREDPILASAVLNALSRTSELNQLLRLFNQTPATLHFLLNFTFAALSGPETPPKRAASDFWQAVLRLQSQSHGRSGRDEVTSVIEEGGSPLTVALVNSFSGNASRGDLNRLSDLLRELTKIGSPFKGWLEQAMVNSEFPSDRVSEADKRRFAQSVILLKSAVKTRETVLNWWIACRGHPTGYG